MRRFFVALRALVYMTGFVLFWGWIALSAREFDRTEPTRRQGVRSRVRHHVLGHVEERGPQRVWRYFVHRRRPGDANDP